MKPLQHFHMKLRIYSVVLSLWTKSYGMTSQIKTSSAEILNGIVVLTLFILSVPNHFQVTDTPMLKGVQNHSLKCMLTKINE